MRYDDLRWSRGIGVLFDKVAVSPRWKHEIVSFTSFKAQVLVIGDLEEENATVMRDVSKQHCKYVRATRGA